MTDGPPQARALAPPGKASLHDTGRLLDALLNPKCWRAPQGILVRTSPSTRHGRWVRLKQDPPRLDNDCRPSSDSMVQPSLQTTSPNLLNSEVADTSDDFRAEEHVVSAQWCSPPARQKPARLPDPHTAQWQSPQFTTLGSFQRGRWLMSFKTDSGHLFFLLG